MMDSTRKHHAFRLVTDADTLNDSLWLAAVITEEATNGGATVLDVKAHDFEPQGCTVFAMLAESHVSIHTWPEERVAELDVFTCGDKIEPYSIGRAIAKRLNASIIADTKVDTRPL